MGATTMGLTRKWRAFREASARVRAETGKSAPAQLAEIVRLRLGRGALGLSEYYELHAYSAPDARAQDSFVGWRKSLRLQSALSSPGWDVTSIDKLVFCSLCEAWGLPSPALRAIFTPDGRRHGNRIPTLATLDDVRAFLAASAHLLPLFVKPVHALTGLGGAGIAAYDAARDRVTLINGKEATLEETIRPHAHNDRYWPSASLFQDLLRPHPEIATRCGPRLCTARIAVLIEKDGPTVLHALFRVATGDNMVDNLRYGVLGNSCGPVEVATGRVLRQDVWVDGREKTVTHHPDTGAPISDFLLPDWEAGLALCKRAALCFGGFRLQGWDLAFTDRGPMLVELNSPFDILGSQAILREGIRDVRVDRVLAELGKTP
jgi:hypothetical protein